MSPAQVRASSEGLRIRAPMSDPSAEILTRKTIGADRFAAGNYALARDLIEGIVVRDEFTEFMTLVGYEHLD